MTALPTVREVAKMIDHSLLHPTMTDAEIVSGCTLAASLGVAAACVKPCAVSLAGSTLAGSGVALCAVVAFPHGSSTVAVKCREADEVAAAGASEIDAVVNIGKVLGDDWDYVTAEITALNDTVRARGAILKVIFENDYLQDRHIVRLCEICGAARVAFVKTSTGYGFVRQPNGMYSYAGAVDRHLALMRGHSPASVGVKAAGGVRTLDDLLRVRALGVTRVGATATAAIVEEARRRGFDA